MTASPGVDISPDGRWLVVSVHEGWAKNELWIRDLKDPRKTAFVPLVTGVEAIFDATVLNDVIYVRTNDGAPRYKVYAVTPSGSHETIGKRCSPRPPRSSMASRWWGASSSRTTWPMPRRAFVAFPRLELPRATWSCRPLVRAAAFRALGRRRSVLRFLVLRGGPHDLPTRFGIGPIREMGSHPIPHRSGAVRGRADQGYLERRDPSSALSGPSRRGSPRMAKPPRCLPGTAGSTSTSCPRSPGRVICSSNGAGILAVANLRGGGEFGEQWHRDGMLERKQNVFDDAIAAAAGLVSLGYTNPAHLAIMGGSNGGLLVGALVTQRPDLFRAAVCSVPLLDMVRYHRFRIAKLWIPEYGSAEEQPSFEWLYAYSPYHRVKQGTPIPRFSS